MQNCMDFKTWQFATKHNILKIYILFFYNERTVLRKKLNKVYEYLWNKDYYLITEKKLVKCTWKNKLSSERENNRIMIENMNRISDAVLMFGNFISRINYLYNSD